MDGTWRKSLGACLTVLFLGTAGVAAEEAQTARADDLPPEFRMFRPSESGQDLQWTLIGRNEKAEEQEKQHPELNAVRAVWHLPLTADRSAFKFDFTRPVRKGDNVLHLYVRADGDENTGRRDKEAHKGVDYMFTMIGGDPNHASTGLSVFKADGSTRRGDCFVVIREESLYLVAEMTLRQQDGRSAFEYSVSSYVKNNGPGSGFAYRGVSSDPAPKASSVGFLMNPALAVINGKVPGWQLARRRRPLEATLAVDDKEKALVIENLFWPEGLTQTASLSPGHYLLRASAKTNVFQIHLVAARARMPVPVSDDHRWVELPFRVLPKEDGSKRAVLLGFRYLARPATGKASRLPARLSVKKVELVRLGNTVLPDHWAQTLPVDPLHRLKLVNDSPAWSRPGRVIFEDSLIGTELWLMTQEGQVDHTYVGHPDFSHDGKYLHIGFRRPPRGLLRTNGSARYLNNDWKGLVWLFPWEQKRLPKGSDPADWIVISRSPEGIQMHNVVTDEDQRIELPSRPGWRVVHFPGIASYGGRGPAMRRITHQTLVWFSDDNRSIGRSNVEGKRFETLPVRSISARPKDDTLYANMSSVGGKSGDNWRDAVDRDGNRYFLFEINRDNFPDHPTNPYQVWALSLAEGDKRGLLRVVFHPKATMKEFVTSQTGMTPQPSANWWDFAAGFPWSGDNGILLLEDGTLVHMSSLGMHSSFAGGTTVSVNCPYTGEVRFVGDFPRFDRVTWPHEFRRDSDYAVVASHAEPATPIVMIDLAHTTMWTVALANFHDYTIRYKTRWNKKAYHKPMFRPAPTFSPDFTKVVFFSSMLTGDHPDRKWGDVYVAVVRYPEPPVNLRREENSLVWDMPRRHAEVRGFRLYRSDESGRNYERVNEKLVTGTQYDLPPGAKGFYVLTSVEHSGLESRMFSTEMNVGKTKDVFRHFYRPAAGKIAPPMVPFFDPAGAGDAYAVAITDPELIYKTKLEEGLSGSVKMRVAIPKTGPARILARVRGMSVLERESYTTGWSSPGHVGSGRFKVRIDGKEAGVVPVEGCPWRWVELNTGAVPLSAGVVELEVATSDVGIAIDNVLVTNDPCFVPSGRGQVPKKLAAVPEGLRAEPFGPQDEPVASRLMNQQGPRVKLVWNPVAAPQGVSHYNVYRSDTENFTADAETLLGSPSVPVFHDVGLEAGRRVYYRVRAVDAWGNQSPASAALAVTVRPAG